MLKLIGATVAIAFVSCFSVLGASTPAAASCRYEATQPAWHLSPCETHCHSCENPDVRRVATCIGWVGNEYWFIDNRGVRWHAQYKHLPPDRFVLVSRRKIQFLDNLQDGPPVH